ncbi:hypothetical protein MBANPS3_009503 [Mucor bainieri]
MTSEAEVTDSIMDEIYQVEIALVGVKPKVHRTVLIPSYTPLRAFHRIVIKAMKWNNSHLHQMYAKDCSDDIVETKLDKNNNVVLDYKGRTIASLLKKPKDKFIYLYDHGDDWGHTITLKDIVPMDESKAYPVCIKGANACPPDDCGGPYGYMSCLKALADPSHPSHSDAADFIERLTHSRTLDPKSFDLDEVNQRLQNLWESCGSTDIDACLENARKMR